MPLIKPRTHRVQTVRHLSRLRAPNRDILFLYARFIGDTVDYVLKHAPSRVMVATGRAAA